MIKLFATIWLSKSRTNQNAKMIKHLYLAKRSNFKINAMILELTLDSAHVA
jgi:hypothetical protein